MRFSNTDAAQGYIDLASFAPLSDTADATAAFSAAVTAAVAGSKRLIIRPRRYYLPNVVGIDAPNGLQIIGDDVDRCVFYSDQEHYMLDIRGGVFNAAGTLLTANAVAGDTQIAVTSATGIAVGAWLNVQSNVIWNASSGKNARYGEMVRVKSIAGTTLTLYAPLDYSYATANGAQANVCGMARDIQLSGLSFEQVTPGTLVSGALVLSRALAPKISDIKGTLLDGPLLSLSAVVNASVKRISGRDLTDDETNGRFGYVVNLGNACRDCRFEELHGNNVRHVITTNSGPSGANAAASTAPNGVPVHNEIINSSGTAGTNAIFSTHEEGDDTTFIGCRAYQSLDMGFELRGTRSRVKACSADGLKGTGVLVQSAALRSEITDFTASNLYGDSSARGNPATGISLAAPETLVDGFMLRDIGNSALLITGANRQRIRNGTIINPGTAGTNKNAIRFSGTSIDHLIENVFVDNASVASGVQGIFAPTTGSAVGTVLTNFRTRLIGSTSVAVNMQNVTTIRDVGPVQPQYLVSSNTTTTL